MKFTGLTPSTVISTGTFNSLLRGAKIFVSPSEVSLKLETRFTIFKDKN